MQEEDKIPRTARESLLIELLGDLGIVHDMIKNLPVEIDGAISSSIKVLADAVEEAENTALTLSKGIEKHKGSVVNDINYALKSSFNKYASETFSEIEIEVKKLQDRINSVELTDPKGRRLSLILSSALLTVTLFSGAAVYGIYSGSNAKIEELNSIITTQYANERRGLSALSPEAKTQYQKAAQSSLN